MASGLPIITTNVGGSKELIKGNGFVVNPRSSEEILDAIRKYLADPSLLTKHGKESRRIAERMSWENVAKDYKSLYNSLLKKHK
jgi:glycosyltransferase involved in cell wall biosynthesis